jgi:uncharacterized membrane protein HdeD (DUF308 family)
MIDGFLLGVIATSSAVAGLFFLKFWKSTHDGLFLAFGMAFMIEGVNRAAMLFLERPSEGIPWNYGVRLFTFLLILGAILQKNYGPRSR